jgi:hypothetical protein
MAGEQTAYLDSGATGTDVVVAINCIDSTGSHTALTIDTTTTRLHGYSVVPTVDLTVGTGIAKITFGDVQSLTEGQRLICKVNGTAGGSAFSEYGIPVVVKADERGTDNASTFDASTTTVDVGKINGDATSASNLQKSTSQIIQGTVSISPSTPASNSTITGAASFYSLDITNQHNDTYIGRLIVFTSGTLIGQATDITDYAYDTGNSAGLFTTTVLTQAPSHNDTFIIV